MPIIRGNQTHKATIQAYEIIGCVTNGQIVRVVTPKGIFDVTAKRVAQKTTVEPEAYWVDEISIATCAVCGRDMDFYLEQMRWACPQGHASVQ